MQGRLWKNGSASASAYHQYSLYHRHKSHTSLIDRFQLLAFFIYCICLSIIPLWYTVELVSFLTYICSKFMNILSSREKVFFFFFFTKLSFLSCLVLSRSLPPAAIESSLIKICPYHSLFL